MRVTVLAGHYGSGKTLLAINLALALRKTYGDVRLCDLDIVNPYFRAADARERLEAAGVRLVVSPWAGSAVELAGFPPEAAAVFDTEEGAAVIDVGGDERGALALGRFAPRLEACEALLVGNMYRPLTAAVEAAREICREIENAGHFRFTGFVNNSNLGAQTTAQDIIASFPWAETLCRSLDLPLHAVAVCREAAEEMAGYTDKLWVIDRFPEPGWRY